MNDLPIVRHTGMLPAREVSGRTAFTYADLAEGLDVADVLVRRQYGRHVEAWDPVETGVSQIDTPSGIQEVRWFTARGAMRFCRYVKSGRSDALFNHLLDLWDAERAGAVALRNPITEVDRFANLAGQVMAHLGGTIREISAKVEGQAERIAAVEERQRVTDPREIEKRMAVLHDLRDRIVEGTAKQMIPITHRAYWQALKRRFDIGSFQNRAALTVPLMDEVIEFARGWALARGVAAQPLFEGATEPSAV